MPTDWFYNRPPPRDELHLQGIYLNNSKKSRVKKQNKLIYL